MQNYSVHPLLQRKFFSAVVPQELVSSSEDLSVRRKRVFSALPSQGSTPLFRSQRRRESAHAHFARLLSRRRYCSSAEVGRPSTGRPSSRLLPSQGSTPSSTKRGCLKTKVERQPYLFAQNEKTGSAEPENSVKLFL